MPRSGRGGRRTGTPGKNYAQRGDLNQNRTLPVSAPSGLGYGERKALEDQQRAMPAPAATPVGSVPPTAALTSGRAPLPPGFFTETTQRPDEPLTAGINLGAGPGSEVLMPVVDPVTEELRALYRAMPNEDLRELIEDREQGWF